MKKLLTTVALVFATTLAHASPVAFTATRGQTSVAVSTASDADAQFGSAPPDALPLTTTSTLFDATSFVSGSALVADGLLSTQAEGSSDGFTSALASASWGGDFVGASRKLLLDFVLDIGDSADVQAFGASTLVVTLLQNGLPFYSEVFDTAGTVSRLIDLMAGATYSLDIVASSEANTLVGGNAFASMLANVQVAAVPEPSTVALLLLAGTMLALARRRR